MIKVFNEAADEIFADTWIPGVQDTCRQVREQAGEPGHVAVGDIGVYDAAESLQSACVSCVE
jgi:hypothetical protein